MSTIQWSTEGVGEPGPTVDGVDELGTSVFSAASLVPVRLIQNFI